MGIMSWDLDAGFNTPKPVRTPRLTVRCEYPGTPMPPTEVTFRLATSYGILTAREAHDWFLRRVPLGPELLRGVEGADGQLTHQIPWLRVFVEGVVIVASILLVFGI
jgi:hypothetical protein